VQQQQQPAQTQGNPQTTAGNIITRQRQEDIAQSREDKALLDRLFHLIDKFVDVDITEV
jgi:hypothetical protein